MPDIVVMFFVLGLFAGLVRSDLSLPKAAYDLISMLLMLTIGLKGGMALYGNLDWKLLPELIAVIALGSGIPLVLFPVLRRLVKLDPADSASIAAHYGSVSAGTFAVALAYVESRRIAYAPEVTLYLVAMELPAIIVALLLYRRLQRDATAQASLGHLWREAFTNRSVILLLGGVIIGMMYGPQLGAPVTDIYLGAFKAVLALFLLEMGLTAAETLRPIPWGRWRLIVFALVTPTLLSLAGIGIALLLQLPPGSAIILASLSASASYIAVPVAIRGTIPEANIGLAMLASLGVTFPFNVLIGIGLYHALIELTPLAA